ncbi:MAG: isochorismatase family cysteine hydrolase [Ilumatobacteraceae bacterium]
MLHRWKIADDQYARHESRRGRRHAFDALDAASTALVVVDMIPFFVDANPYARGIVANITALADAVRSAGGIVAWIVPASQEPSAARREFLGASVAETYRTSGGDGPLRDRLWHELVVEHDDIVLAKSSPGAFLAGHCDLDALLRRREVDTVIVAGTVANVCCESTVREASALGYRVIMVADANAAVRDDELNATLHTVYRSFGDVRTTDETVELVRSGPAVGEWQGLSREFR